MMQREDSSAKLRRLLNEANAKIRELESRPEPEPKIVFRDVVREVAGPEIIVEVPVPFEVERIVYRDVEKVVEVPVAVERIVYRDVEKVVEVPVEVPVPFEVERIVYRDVEKVVEVPVAYYPPSIHQIETERVVYHDNPEHIETIRRLQERICQYTSQSDL